MSCHLMIGVLLCVGWAYMCTHSMYVYVCVSMMLYVFKLIITCCVVVCCVGVGCVLCVVLCAVCCVGGGCVLCCVLCVVLVLVVVVLLCVVLCIHIHILYVHNYVYIELFV